MVLRFLAQKLLCFGSDYDAFAGALDQLVEDTLHLSATDSPLSPLGNTTKLNKSGVMNENPSEFVADWGEFVDVCLSVCLLGAFNSHCKCCSKSLKRLCGLFFLLIDYSLLRSLK